MVNVTARYPWTLVISIGCYNNGKSIKNITYDNNERWKFHSSSRVFQHRFINISESKIQKFSSIINGAREIYPFHREFVIPSCSFIEWNSKIFYSIFRWRLFFFFFNLIGKFSTLSRKFDRIKDSIKANLWHLTASILLGACSATQYRSCCDHRDVYTAYLPSVQIFNLSELVCGCRVLHFPIIRRIYLPLFRKESRIKYLFTHTRACRSIKSRGRRLEQTVRGEFRRAISVD